MNESKEEKGSVQYINAFTAPPENEDLGFGEAMVRQDLSQLKVPATPKNEIDLIRLTSQLLKYMEQVCKENQIKLSKENQKNAGNE